MATKTHKYTDSIAYTVETAESSSLALDIRLYNKGCLKVPAADTYTFYGSTTGTGTFVAAYSSAASPAALTIVAGGQYAYAIPDDVFKFPFIKITAASQRSCTLAFKDPGA